MNNHKNSRTTVHNREIIVGCMINENVRPADVARDLDISVRTVRKWLRRHRDEGPAGLEESIQRSQYPAAQVVCGG